MFLRRVTLKNLGVSCSGLSLSAIVVNNSTQCVPPKENIVSQITVYQYKICPFCQRTKAYFDYLKMPYKSIEVNPLTKAEIDFSPRDKKKVPIAIFNGTVVHDSRNIIACITQHLKDENNNSINVSEFLASDTEFWNEWSEKKLAVMLYPNITRSFPESWECFGYSENVQTWSWTQRQLVRVIGPVAMYFVNGKIKKKYGIVNEREELHALLRDWTDALQSNKFLHGERPSLPDVLVFGVIRSIETTETFHDIMKENNKLKIWYQEMKTLTPTQE